MFSIRALVLLAGIGVCAGSARADDLTPPPWRFGPDTTFQHWDFSGGSAGGAPDGAPAFNPNGTPILTPDDPGNWLSSLGTRNDVWAVNDFDKISFHVPNDGTPGYQKELWLQVTFQALAILPIGKSITSPSGNFTLQSTQQTQLSDGWIHELSIWTLPSCPTSEDLVLTPPIPGTVVWVDQVVIDTRCTPVPAPGLFTTAPCLVAAWARRRRRA